MSSIDYIPDRGIPGLLPWYPYWTGPVLRDCRVCTDGLMMIMRFVLKKRYRKIVVRQSCPSGLPGALQLRFVPALPKPMLFSGSIRFVRFLNVTASIWLPFPGWFLLDERFVLLMAKRIILSTNIFIRLFLPSAGNQRVSGIDGAGLL